MSLAATTVSIILTFGTTAIINRRTKNAEKREMAVMILYDMRETLKEMEGCDADLNAFFDLQVDMIAHPQKYEEQHLQLTAYTPLLDYTTTTENIFRSNIETIKTIGNILFVEIVSSFYDNRDYYKNKLIDEFVIEVEKAIESYEDLVDFDSAGFPFFSQSYLRKMKGEYEQCKLMMKVTDEELEVFSKAQQKLQEDTEALDSDESRDKSIRDMEQRWLKLQQAREEGKKALQRSVL